MQQFNHEQFKPKKQLHWTQKAYALLVELGTAQPPLVFYFVIITFCNQILTNSLSKISQIISSAGSEHQFQIAILSICVTESQAKEGQAQPKHLFIFFLDFTPQVSTNYGGILNSMSYNLVFQTLHNIGHKKYIKHVNKLGLSWAKLSQTRA